MAIMGNNAASDDENARLRMEKQVSSGVSTRFGSRRALGDIGNLVGAITNRNHASGNSKGDAKEDETKVRTAGDHARPRRVCPAARCRRASARPLTRVALPPLRIARRAPRSS